MIVLCGLEYLILRARNNNPMMNLDYAVPETKEKIEKVVSSVMKAFFQTRKAEVKE